MRSFKLDLFFLLEIKCNANVVEHLKQQLGLYGLVVGNERSRGIALLWNKNVFVSKCLTDAIVSISDNQRQ